MTISLKTLTISIFSLLFSTSVFSGTIDDFFEKHHDLKDNLPIRVAISVAARQAASSLAVSEGKYDNDTVDVNGETYTDRLIKNQGDYFAIIGFRDVKNKCEYPTIIARMRLVKSDCDLIKSKDI